MQVRTELLNGILNNSFGATGASDGAEYRLYLKTSGGTPPPFQTITFAAASGGQVVLASNSKPVFFLVSNVPVVSGIEVRREMGGEDVMFEILLDTPESYEGITGVFSVLDVTVKLQPQT